MTLGIPKVVSLVVLKVVDTAKSVIANAGEVGDGVSGLKISSRASTIWDIVEQALNFLTSHELTGLLLVAYLIKRIGFGMWRSAKRSV